jgi:hypothetical protein
MLRFPKCSLLKCKSIMCFSSQRVLHDQHISFL